MGLDGDDFAQLTFGDLVHKPGMVVGLVWLVGGMSDRPEAGAPSTMLLRARFPFCS